MKLMQSLRLRKIGLFQMDSREVGPAEIRELLNAHQMTNAYSR